MKVVTLGSRKNLCVNPTVRKLSSVNEMNYECLKRQEKNETKCAYYDKEKVHDLSCEIYVNGYIIFSLIFYRHKQLLLILKIYSHLGKRNKVVLIML